MAIDWQFPSECWGTQTLETLAPEVSNQVRPAEKPLELFNYWGLDAIEKDQFTEPSTNFISGVEISSTCVQFGPMHVLYSKLRPYLNKVIVPSIAGIGTTEWIVLAPQNDLLDRTYLAYVLRTKKFVDYATANSTGARMPRARKDALRQADIPIPYPDDPTRSLAEQRRIVARIEALFAELQEGRRLKTLIDTDNDNLISGALEEALDNVFSESPEILVLSDFASAFNGRASGEGDSDIRVFKTKHVYPFNLRLDEPSFMKAEQAAKCPSDRFLQPDDVLLCNIARGTLGRPAYVESVDGKWSTDTSVMILRAGEKCLGKWLFYYLYSKRGQEEIAAREKGIIFADKRGQTHLYPKDMLTLPVPLPPPSRQQEIVSYLDSIQHSQKQIQESQTELQTYFDEFEQAILVQAFSGEL